MLESDLVRQISEFTIKNGRMPKEVHGSFMQLAPIGTFSGHMSMVGKSGYSTPLGVIELVLDAEAKEIYFL